MSDLTNMGLTLDGHKIVARPKPRPRFAAPTTPPYMLTMALPLFPVPHPEQIVCQLGIPGEPATKGRHRFSGRGSAYTPTETRAATAYIAWAIHSLYPDLVASRQPMGFIASFYLSTGYSIDLDNLAKLVMDAGQGLLWHNDRQICQKMVDRHLYQPEPRTELLVYTLDH